MKTAAIAVSLTLAGILALAPLGHAQLEPRPEGRVDIGVRPSEAEVGDVIVATLTVTAPPGAIGPPVFPDWSEAWGEAEVREAGPVEDTGGSRFQQKVRLTVFRTGGVVLPPVTVEVPTAKEVLLLPSKPLTLEIRSVLPPDVENPNPRPPAPPRALPIGESFWRVTFALVAACLVAAVFLARRRSQARRAEIAAVPPLEALARGLESLRNVEECKAFHTSLSLYLRRFLGRSFSFPALESTTTEVRYKLTDTGTPRPLVSRAEKILRHCDLVKFAQSGLAPLAPEPPGSLGARLEEVLELGRELDQHLQPPEPTPPEQGTEQAA
ncbi:MAG: hypothetical protein OES47_02715 [Acidobacteriota bacterium]|nr:hypothetical protein [Acidobacteriota bacterium]